MVHLAQSSPSPSSSLFTVAHLDELRLRYAKIRTVDPTSQTYARLIALLGHMSQAQLEQVAGANIQWLSPLASRVIAPRRLYCSCCGESVWGRQWHNMDTGHGVCTNCFRINVTREGQVEAERIYGVPGTHHGVADQNGGAS